MELAVKLIYLLVQAIICLALVASILLKQSKDDGGGGILGGPMQANVRIQGTDDTIDIWTKRLAGAFLVSSFLGGILFKLFS